MVNNEDPPSYENAVFKNITQDSTNLSPVNITNYTYHYKVNFKRCAVISIIMLVCTVPLMMALFSSTEPCLVRNATGQPLKRYPLIRCY